MKNLSKIFIFVLSLFLLPGISQATEFISPNSNGVVIFDSTQETKELIITAGQEVNINGKTGDGAIVAGANINLSSDFSNHVFALGSRVVVKGDIKGNLMVIASELTIERTSKIEGDVLLLGGSSVFIGGEIGGNLIAKNSTALTISGQIDGNVEFDNLTNLTTTSSARIGGNIKGVTQNSATISPETEIKGSNQISVTPVNRQIMGSVSSLVLSFISMLVLLTALKFIAPKFVDTTRQYAFDNPLKSLGLGALTLFGGIIIIIMSFALGFTYLIGILLLLGWIQAIILGGTFSYIWVADALSNKKLNIYIAAILGICLFLVLNLTQLIHAVAFINALVFLVGIGASVIGIFTLIKKSNGK